MQDTGTGGSYPVSSDRAVWAIGAWQLHEASSTAPSAAPSSTTAYEAIAQHGQVRPRWWCTTRPTVCTLGEQSFLDWREQSYPAWTATDTVQIGMSKSLSTNVGHYVLLRTAAALAAEQGLTTESAGFQAWADQLQSDIVSHFWLASDGQFSTFSTTFLDPSFTQRYDLLGSALAILAEVADPSQAATVVQSYPQLPKGPPVLWPQQQFTPIYHNRGIWPFVTAYLGYGPRPSACDNSRRHRS
jgi:hypothetical protein